MTGGSWTAGRRVVSCKEAMRRLLDRRWLDPEWYRYLGDRIGPQGVVLFWTVVLGLLAFGGYEAVRGVTPAASKASEFVPLTTTVTKLVRVLEHGRVVVKRVPVVRRVYAKPVTIQETRTIRTAGGTRVVRVPVVRYRPVYRREVITVKGKPKTVARIVTDTAMLTDTKLLTVTSEHTATVVDKQTQTVNQTVSETVTTSRTVTAPPETVTLPAQTVIQTAPPQTVTVTEPSVTVTVTVTGPSGGGGP